MKTFTVQRMPNGFEVDAPPFGYWFKAGAALMLGAGAASTVAVLLGYVVFFVLLGGAAGLFHVLAR
jgi:hypothetical protein